MYKVLLVDDEAPALRFMQAIIEKYANAHYQVAAACASAEDALSFLSKQSIDLLMTDISMPGMDGITLAHKARVLYPDIHIVIISGYAEFEYAKSAIQAAVDDYILKPVSLTHMTEILGRIAGKLDEETAEREPRLLSALLAGQPYDQALAAQLYGEGKYSFALVRWGNLITTADTIYSTTVLRTDGAPFTVLSGRDEDEQLLFAGSALPPSEFQGAVKAYVAQRRSASTWTIIFSRGSDNFAALPVFFRKAARLTEQTLSIGRHQFLFLTGGSRGMDMPHIANTTLKKLEYFIRENNTKMVKDILITLAADWEKRQLPQIYVSSMVQQLVNLTLINRPSLSSRHAAVLRETHELFRYASSYGSLMAGVYSILFDDNVSRDKKLSAEELYQQAIEYIRERYAEPISILNVCSEIGISQTYLSRLFRKYGETSFNAFLTQCRIENAIQLIQQHPDILLRDVAACVGYDDSSYFSKVFHQATGCTPSQYAANLHGDEEHSLAEQ